MLLTCCTHYASKFGKLSSGHRTGRDQFSFQSQRRAMPKNVQTSGQLCSFHMLPRLCSKSFKLGFSSMWIENFQMYKLGFKEAEEPEITLPTFLRSWRKQGSSRKTSTSSSLTMLKPLTMGIKTNYGKFLKIWEYYLTCLLRNLCMWFQEATFGTRHGTKNWFKIGKGVCQGYILSPCLFNFCAEYIRRNIAWMNHKLKSRLLGEISTISDMQIISF